MLTLLDENYYFAFEQRVRLCNKRWQREVSFGRPLLKPKTFARNHNFFEVSLLSLSKSNLDFTTMETSHVFFVI